MKQWVVCPTCSEGLRPPGSFEVLRCRHYDEIMVLVKRHRLGFLNNAGGGEFTLPGGDSIQIPNMGEYDDDLAQLRTGLQVRGLEPVHSQAEE